MHPKRAARWVLSLGLWETLLDKAVDFITEANYPGRAARPLAISNIETRFHVQFSNLSLPGCPTSAPYTHSEQAVLSLCLLNPRGEGRQGGIFVCPFNLHLSWGFKRPMTDSHIPALDLFCNSISRIWRVLNQCVSILFREYHGNLQTKLYFISTPACGDVPVPGP